MEELRDKLEKERIMQELLAKEQKTFHNFQKALRLEEELLRLKSHSFWLQEGYRNREFFHSQAKDRIWRNKVKEITNVDWETVSYFEQIKVAAYKYLERLYKEDNNIDLDLVENMLANIPTLISSEDNEKLNSLVMEEEVWGVIHQMNPDKASNPNGYSTHFYKKKCWHVIKKDLLIMIQYVKRLVKIGSNTNFAFLDLIPKEVNPSSFARY